MRGLSTRADWQAKLGTAPSFFIRGVTIAELEPALKRRLLPVLPRAGIRAFRSRLSDNGAALESSYSWLAGKEISP